jgi:hypothetical protein
MRILIGCAAVALAAGLGAAGLAGVTMPDTVPVSGKTLRLNGLGLRTKVFFKIYVAGLYLENPTHDAAQAVSADETKRVVMHFLYKNVTKKQLVEAWDEGFDENAGPIGAEVKAGIAQLDGWMGDVSAGQEIVFTYEAGTGTTVEFAGQKKGTIPGADFMRALWKVWLGEHPPTSDLKKGLLGKT